MNSCQRHLEYRTNVPFVKFLDINKSGMKTELKKIDVWTGENSWNVKANINMSPDKAMDGGFNRITIWFHIILCLLNGEWYSLLFFKRGYKLKKKSIQYQSSILCIQWL